MIAVPLAVHVSFRLDVIWAETWLGGDNNHKMSRNLSPYPSASTHSNQDAKASRRGSGAHADSPSVAGRTVTPTSERIIKETTVKRRKAMEVLANR